jgi:hypothetical protein
MQISNTVRIDRHRREVFAFLSHFENLPLWNPAIRHTHEVGTGRTGVGARYVQARTTPTPAVETFEVTRYDPERVVAVRGTLGPFRAESTYLLESYGDTTVLTNVMELEPRGVPPLTASLARGRIERAVARNLRTLKQVLERGAVPGTA